MTYSSTNNKRKRNRKGSSTSGTSQFPSCVFFVAVMAIGVVLTDAFWISNQVNNKRKAKDMLSSLRGWSQSAEFIAKEDGSLDVSLEDVEETAKSATTSSTKTGRKFDLSSPREWLEYWEDFYNQSGVYTVLRCDYQCHHDDAEDELENGDSNHLSRWIVWGRDFHLQRLQKTMESLLLERRKSKMGEDWNSTDIAKFKQETDLILNTLLSRAEHLILEQINTQQSSSSPAATPASKEGDEAKLQRDVSSVKIVTVMVTLLWQLTQQKQHYDGTTSDRNNYPKQGFEEGPAAAAAAAAAADILIKGHACSSCLPTMPLLEQATAAIPPLSAVVALPINHDTSSSLSSWPSRLSFQPRAKLSSWCRQRRPLEESLKLKGIEEVFLVKVNDDKEGGDSYEILEGLISNAFFVYPGGILCTARRGVLEGYARHLVLESAPHCGLLVVEDVEDTTAKNNITNNPLLVSTQDANQWQEVFITSSVRLVVPVHEIYLPRYKHNHETYDNNNSSKENHNVEVALELLWRRPPQEETCTSTAHQGSDNRKSYWRSIYEHILSKHYQKI
jgi:hypothetical protein